MYTYTYICVYIYIYKMKHNKALKGNETDIETETY